MEIGFEQIMDEFDNDNFYYENEPDDELPMQQSIQDNGLPLSVSDAQMAKQDVFEPENNLMIEDEVSLVLEQQSLDVEMNETGRVDDDKENENPIELLKAPMPPPPAL